jgi:hypothetical protein
MSARYRWLILVHGERFQAQPTIYGTWLPLYFKNSNEAEDYAEGMIESPDFGVQDGDLEIVRTLVFRSDKTGYTYPS